MLNLPQRTLDKVKKVLLRQQREVAKQLKSIEKEDPVLAGGIEEASEPGTDSWQADVHARLVSLKGDLTDLYKKIGLSLFRIRSGIYGQCERCGQAIESQRLEAMPTATLCIACSKNPPESKAL